MGKRTKELTDTVAATGATRMPRRAVRGRDPQCRPRIGEARELGVLAQARQHTATGIGDDELEGAVARSIGNDTACRLTAMLEDIVLKLAERAHQPTDQTPRQPGSDSGILGMFGPLIPSELRGFVATWIKARQRKYPGAVTRTRAADGPVPQRAFDLVKDQRFNSDGPIGGRNGGGGHRELNQRPDPAGTGQNDLAKLRQATGHRLPEQVIGRLKACADALWPPFAQVASRPSHPRRRRGQLPRLSKIPVGSIATCEPLDINFKRDIIQFADQTRTSH